MRMRFTETSKRGRPEGGTLFLLLRSRNLSGWAGIGPSASPSELSPQPIGDLKGMVDENRLRADLHYRLAVFPLNGPPLRQRRGDTLLLTRYFVRKYARRLERNMERIPTSGRCF
jgi:hypothetical protein